MKLVMYIMATEPISTVYYTDPSHQAGYLYVYPSLRPFVTRQRLIKHVPAATNKRNNRRIAGRVCLWVYVFPLFTR
jgi:hypothetical protein